MSGGEMRQGPKSPEDQLLDQLEKLLKQIPQGRVEVVKRKVDAIFARALQKSPEPVKVPESSSGFQIPAAMNQKIMTKMSDRYNVDISNFFKDADKIGAENPDVQKNIANLSEAMRSIEKISQSEFKPANESNEEYLLSEPVYGVGENLYGLSSAFKYDEVKKYKVAILFAQILNSMAPAIGEQPRYQISLVSPNASFNGVTMYPLSGKRDDLVYGSRVGKVYSWAVVEKGNAKFPAKVSL